MKKYELTDITIEQSGVTLYRIRAVRAIKAFGVKKGDLGGYVEKEENLSQSGNAWVSDNASVYGDASVSDNASVYGDAWVYDNAWVSDNASVYGDARVSGDAWVLWCSKIGSRLGTTTAFIEEDGGVKIVCGCFCGTLNEFEKKVEETHGDNIYGKEYKAFIELIKIHFGKV